MCFGNETEVKKVDTEKPAWLQSAAQGNVNYATNLQNQGFTPYSGSMVAGFSPEQLGSFGLGSDVAGGVAPYVGATGGLIANYATAAPQSVTPSTIASRMSPYMSQYVQQALQPQLQMQDQQFATQNKGVDSAATMAGAFGDTGWGELRGTTTQAQDAARQGLIGQAYNTAFNTAIGAGAQDVATDVNAQTTNANLAEQGLTRQLTGANAFYNMGTGAANLTNTQGAQQTAQQQADLNAQYNEFLRMMYQDPQFRSSIMNSSLGAGAGSTGSTATTTAPDNSGYGMLGSMAGTAGMLMFSDPKLKENVEQVGELYDGTPVHSFNFKGDRTPRIGLMAPEVKKRTPEAVDESGPFKKVNYSLATRRSAKLAKRGLDEQFGGDDGPMMLAGGGFAPPGADAVVGERGPEGLRMLPGGGAQVIPNHQLPQFMGAGNGAQSPANIAQLFQRWQQMRGGGGRRPMLPGSATGGMRLPAPSANPAGAPPPPTGTAPVTSSMPMSGGGAPPVAPTPASMPNTNMTGVGNPNPPPLPPPSPAMGGGFGGGMTLDAAINPSMNPNWGGMTVHGTGAGGTLPTPSAGGAPQLRLAA